ncbi:hypothetical protein [Parasedimentitalea denitrificans]|uniref:hypothetical protein n=1 Tax=Parasedimentitalea denitrificans TaxID=2211118 RepID=UPI0019803FCC|nr:hypothetical protein [Sedimentitalea sp. CY04]
MTGPLPALGACLAAGKLPLVQGVIPAQRISAAWRLFCPISALRRFQQLSQRP